MGKVRIAFLLVLVGAVAGDRLVAPTFDVSPAASDIYRATATLASTDTTPDVEDLVRVALHPARLCPHVIRLEALGIIERQGPTASWLAVDIRKRTQIKRTDQGLILTYESTNPHNVEFMADFLANLVSQEEDARRAHKEGRAGKHLKAVFPRELATLALGQGPGSGSEGEAPGRF